MRERKYKKKRLPRKVYLVICEGETEKVYVETLRRHYRLPVTIKAKVSGNSINGRLVVQYISELGVDKNDDYSIFYVYDADVKSVVEKVAALPGEMILTNPCLELWYILHADNHSKAINSNDVIKLLKNSHPAWKSYMKGHLTSDQNSLLRANCKDATERAKKLNWPDNPSSNIWLFIEALENEKS